MATNEKDLILIAGHYEGYDERIVGWVDQQISIGKYVLTSGELSSLVVADSVTRLLPDVLSSPETANQDSFADDELIEHPHYTKPEKISRFEGATRPVVGQSSINSRLEKGE